MKNILDELIYIEQQAAASWDKLEEEKGGLLTLAQEEIARRTAELNLETNLAIQTISQSINQEMNEKIKRIQQEHQRAVKRMETLFEKHQETWRNRILSCILEV